MKKPLSKRFIYIITGCFIFAIVLSSIFLFVLKTNGDIRFKLLQNPIIQHFRHTYNSVRKLPDLLFVPYLFTNSNIPTYNLSIPVDNIILMNSVLPDDPIVLGKLAEENKLFVKAQFEDFEEKYNGRVDIKYRGINANHWNSLKKSYRIKFPDNNFWKGQRLVNFVTPYDRAYQIELLNMYRAKKFGLIDLDMNFVRLNINGVDAGVYLMFEHWSYEFLSKKKLPESKIYGLQDGDIVSNNTVSNYIDILNKEDEIKKEELVTILDIRDKVDEETFKKLLPQILDMEKFYRWNIINILAGSNHQNENANTVLYFNNITGKFEMVPWDTNIGNQNNIPYRDNDSILVKRVMSIPEFRTRRDQILREYIEDSANLKDDLAFYDNLGDQVKNDFLKDNFKYHTNFKYLSSIKEYRKLIIDNFEKAELILNSFIDYSDFETSNEGLSFSGSFECFGNIALSIDKFLFKNPQFYKINQTTIGLSGTHIFYKDVVIPPDIALNIIPNSTIFLDDDVSIISYGSIDAYGGSLAPISIRRLNPNKPWGTFAVINAKEPSNFSHFYADGGSGKIINGIVITGMVAIHNSDVDISNAHFSNSNDDDALNTKMALVKIENSSFKDTSSDGIDIDFAKENSFVIGNTFVNVGGDAIDVSFSDIPIQNNKVAKCGDKGISIGEVSQPVISNNSISECDIGIAIKDLSEAIITSNTIFDNNTAVSLYRKKDEFGGATAILGKNDLINNAEDIKTDSLSKIIYE